jgi:hypothetical protein
MLERSSGLVFTFHLNIISVRSFLWTLRFARTIKVNESGHRSPIHRPQRRPRFWRAPAVPRGDSHLDSCPGRYPLGGPLPALSGAIINAGEHPARPGTCISLGARAGRL